MAASKAPTANTTNVSSTSTSTSSTTTDNIEHNFHELCRSCGKTNAELYDLFQTTNSPFSTSSTTCYTHLNNCNFTSSSRTASTTTTTATISPSTTANNQPSTSTTKASSSTVTTAAAAAGCTIKSSSSRECLTTFDSVAATAKATAKGQSNMDNILQEMQIWQLLIKCNDGLPQRICAKCTAQFYMIHKFRRKCLKVQTQLRALYEEQQQKFYERQQQQENEKNLTVKEATTIEATSTPTTETNAKAASSDSASLLVETVKPPAAVMHKVNDLVSDNLKEKQEAKEENEQQQQQQQQELGKEKEAEAEQANVDNTNIKSLGSSVSFEANTGNTNDFIAPTTTTAPILRDNVETMPQKTEATEPTPTSSPPPPAPPTTTLVPVPISASATSSAFNDKTFETQIQEHCCTVTTQLFKLKDEKKPLLKPSVLDAKRSPPLTLKQPLEQICDKETENLNKTTKFCFDQENLLDNINHNLFTNKITKNTDSSGSSCSANSSPLSKANDNKNVAFNFRISTSTGCDGGGGGAAAAVGLAKISTENLFITKAALKAYTIPPATSGEQNKNRDHQKPITNSEAIELKSSNNNDNNNNNNNAHINTIYTSNRYDNRNQQQLNDSTCSSTSNSTPTTSSSSSSSPTLSSSSKRCCSKKHKKRLNNNNTKTKIIKYASHNKRPGHCYKTNAKAKALNEKAAAKMARTIQSYGKCDIDSTEMATTATAAATQPLLKRRKPDKKHKLKNLLQKKKTTTSSTLLKASARQTCRRKKHHLNNFKICHKKSIQIEDEMSNTTVSTTSLTSTKFTNTITSFTASSSSASCSSTTVSSSSSTTAVTAAAAAISSTSLFHLRATTPATLNNDLVRNSRIMTKNGCSSSADSLSSSLKACSKMWKTKAAMKANANDMPVKVKPDDNDDDDDDQPTGNKAQITLPYIETKTTTISSSPEIHISSKTLTDNLTDQCGNHNKVTMSSAVKQDKDINCENKIVTNLKTEEAGQKQFNTTATTQQQQQQTENNVEEIKIATIENVVTDMALNNLGINKESENPHEEQNKQEDDKQQQQQEEQKLDLPPAKKGSMKLIIQRKRGKRFKCRPKSEDEIPPNNQPETQPSLLKTKRKRKECHYGTRNLKIKLENIAFIALDNPATTSKNMPKKEEQEKPSAGSNFRETNNEDEQEENPIPITNNYDFDSDSNVSVYRDPLLLRNEALEEDTHVTDFVKIPLSIQNECSKETYKLYKEKALLESPKKLIVRVPLTSLTQDFKRLHLNKEEVEEDIPVIEDNNELENPTNDNNSNLAQIPNETVETTKETKQLETPDLNKEQIEYSSPSSQLNHSSSGQSEFMGFSQPSTNENSSVNSAEIIRYIEPPLCSASSKITDFINDFQNNCIDSSEIEESCDIIPTLGAHITQELSDEIRDVEDTLNGIISEMHDKDMYTPKSSAETDEFFNHSLYSPLTDAPTTPSQSFYAESPCTINSNPMSVSPFIHHNMDYNAMTPQSQHSGMGFGSSSSCMGSVGGSTGPHASMYSEHYPSYNECNEETTQSELIGFQNDIPCFENIEAVNNNNMQDDNEQDQQEEEEEEMEQMALENDNMNQVENEFSPTIEQFAHMPEESLTPQQIPIVTEHIQPKQFPYASANAATNYQHISATPTFHVQTTAVNPLVSRATATQPHYIVTNTNQGQLIIANPSQINGPAREQQIVPPFKPHSNNLQFVTLGQAMKAAQPTATTNQLLNNNAGPQWATTTTVTNAPNFNQRPIFTQNNGTTTYFVNANGEIYQANIPSNPNPPPVNTTIFVPPNTNQAFAKSRLDNTMSTIQQQQQQHAAQQQRPHPQNSNPSSQYIMLVNNLNGSPQYYTTTPVNNHIQHQTVSPAPQNINPPTVIIQPAAAPTAAAPAPQVNQTNPSTSSTNVQSNIIKTEPSTLTTPTTATAAAAGTLKSNHIPITPAREPREDLTMRQLINQQLQKQIKQRQLQLLQPRSQNVAQKINLICRFCHKRPKFTNNVDYSNHIISTHPAEKPYNCPSCPTHFSRRSDRQMHVAQVHGARYQCAQCGLSFCAQRTLDFHLQKYHANMGRSEQLAHLQQQQQRRLQNSSSTTTSAATYQLLQHNQQQRLVRVEDVHVEVTAENKTKRSIDLPFDNAGGDGGADMQSLNNEVEMLSSHTDDPQQQQRQQKSRKLCCPDCNGDNDDCCGGDSDQNHDQNDINSSSNYATEQAATNSNLQNTGNESVNNHPQQHPQHVTIPSPEQTEPDSTTTLRHFRKRQLCEISTSFASSSPSSSSSSTSSFSLHNNAGNNNGCNDNHNSPDNVLAGDGGGGEQIVVERTLRGSHNCLLCEESFTNEIALRKHHQLAHGAATQSQSSMTCSSATISSMPLVCTVCKRGFRMRNALQRHMETHDAEGRPYECNICQVRFPRPSQLTLHKLTVHKFEKPNSCDECGKKFGTESAMKAHAIEHEKAAIMANATSEPLTSTTASSSQSLLSSHEYVETITNTTTTSTNNNEQNMNLELTTSGEDASESSININAAAQNSIVSGGIVS